MPEIYADHAATSFPRPEAVGEAMASFLRDIGCNPGRGGYRRSLDAGRMVYETRQVLADLFNVQRPEQVVFTPSVTYSLNLVIKGLLGEGDHVLASSMEHNAVVRPLALLSRERGLAVEYLPCNGDGSMDAAIIKKYLRSNTKLVILTHASNVTGTLLPVYEVGELLRGAGVFYAVDTAQTAGSEVVDFNAMNCDFLAFTGHKGLLGPPGIGGLCISERAAEQTSPLVEGGTGSRSEEDTQPPFLPDKFESGTLNLPGVAGLAAGIEEIRRFGLPEMSKHKKQLTAAFLAGLSEISGVTVYGTRNTETSTATVSINAAGQDSGDLSFILDRAFGIMTRSGLHCSPAAHRTIGTFPAGTLRFSFGYGNTRAEIDTIISALSEILGNKNFTHDIL